MGPKLGDGESANVHTVLRRLMLSSAGLDAAQQAEKDKLVSSDRSFTAGSSQNSAQLAAFGVPLAAAAGWLAL